MEHKEKLAEKKAENTKLFKKQNKLEDKLNSLEKILGEDDKVDAM